MATITQVQNQVQNAEGMLDIVNPVKGHWTCVGYAPSQHRRCWNPADLHNRTAADVLLRSLAHGTRTDLELRQTLHQIAGYLLCRRNHQNQAASVVAQWHAVIRANALVYNAPGPTITLVNPTPVPAPGPQQAPIYPPTPVHNPVPVQTSDSSSLNVVPGHSNDIPVQEPPDSNREETRDDSVPRGRTNEHSAEPGPSAQQTSIEQARPSRSAVRRARERFIADLEAQDRSRRAEAAIQHARQEAETRRLAEDEMIQQEVRQIRRELERICERPERRRIQQERAQQGAEARESAERVRLEQVRAEQQLVQREQAKQAAEDRGRLMRRIARREQQDVVVAEQQSRELEEQERSRWDEVWTMYEQDWDHMSRISTFELDEDIKESVPWPVRSGRWQDVDPGNVILFFQHAPAGQSSDHSQLRRLLREQIWRWHGDRLQRSFPRIADDADALAVAVVVMQVINAMLED